jgi:hypothetical protein
VPIGAYALCAVAVWIKCSFSSHRHSSSSTLQVQYALRTYSTGEYVTTRGKFEDAKCGKTTRKIIGLLRAQGYHTWNAIFTQLARTGEELKKHLKKAWGTPQAPVESEGDSDDKLEVFPSNVAT